MDYDRRIGFHWAGFRVLGSRAPSRNCPSARRPGPRGWRLPRAKPKDSFEIRAEHVDQVSNREELKTIL